MQGPFESEVEKYLPSVIYHMQIERADKAVELFVLPHNMLHKNNDSPVGNKCICCAIVCELVVFIRMVC